MVCAAAAAAKSLQSCPTLCNPIDSSPPGPAVPGILQARTLEWVAISFSNVWKWKVKGKSLSRVRPLATPWTAAYQSPPSMGFSRQKYWSGVPLPSPYGMWTIPQWCYFFLISEKYLKKTILSKEISKIWEIMNHHIFKLRKYKFLKKKSHYFKKVSGLFCCFWVIKIRFPNITFHFYYYLALSFLFNFNLPFICCWESLKFILRDNFKFFYGHKMIWRETK